MKTLNFIYQDEQLPIEIDELNKTATINIPLSGTKITNILETEVLDIQHLHFLSPTTMIENDILISQYNIEKLHLWEESKELDYLEKLRLCLNAYTFGRYTNLKVTCLLDTNNLLFDDNLMPFTLHRGIMNKLYPYVFDEQAFFENYKALVLATLYPSLTFEALYNGAASLVRGNTTIRTIAKAEDALTIFEVLETAYENEKRKVERSKMKVSKVSHKIYMFTTYISVVLVVALVGTLMYIGGNVLPYQQKLLEAHDSFLASDYQETIAVLKHTNVAKLPQSTQFELAFAYLQSESLSSEQRQIIQKNLSLKSDPKYLQYWIYNGQGELEEAKDLAKKLDDVELVIFVLEKQITNTQANESLSGKEKEEQLKALSEELEKFSEIFNKALTPDETSTNN